MPLNFPSIFHTFLHIVRHPLNKGRKIKALGRWVTWQIGSRLVGGPVSIPFVGHSRLLVSPGMTGATGNIYVGLQEFEEMSFVLHFLRQGDLFIDIGANIGAYSVLASKVCGSYSIAFEPAPSTYKNLLMNISLNDIGDKVTVVPICLSNERGIVKFTPNLDTVNHVHAGISDLSEFIEVETDTLDNVLGNRMPNLIKLDVEGFEALVLLGAHRVLSSEKLCAIIMEINGSGARYGYDDSSLHYIMEKYKFRPYRYDPFNKHLRPIVEGKSNLDNIIFLRNIDFIERRIKDSAKFVVHEKSL